MLGGAPRQTVALQDLDLCHVQPVRVKRYVVKLDLAQQGRGALRTEHFFEALAQVRWVRSATAIGGL